MLIAEKFLNYRNHRSDNLFHSRTLFCFHHIFLRFRLNMGNAEIDVKVASSNADDAHVMLKYIKGQILVSSDTRPDGPAPLEGSNDIAASTVSDLVMGQPPVRKPSGSKSAGRARSTSATNDNNVGKVLRSVYQKAIDEDIPPEMLDLLSKLD